MQVLCVSYRYLLLLRIRCPFLLKHLWHRSISRSCRCRFLRIKITCAWQRRRSCLSRESINFVLLRGENSSLLALCKFDGRSYRWNLKRRDGVLLDGTIFFLTDFTDTGSSTTRKFGEPRNICGNAVLPTSITKLLFIPANDVTFYKDSFPRERRAWKLRLHILRSRVNIAEKIKSRNVSSLWTICLSEQEIIWLSASFQPRFRKVSNPSEFI